MDKFNGNLSLLARLGGHQLPATEAAFTGRAVPTSSSSVPDYSPVDDLAQQTGFVKTDGPHAIAAEALQGGAQQEVSQGITPRKQVVC